MHTKNELTIKTDANIKHQKGDYLLYLKDNKNAITKCRKNNVGAKTSDLRAGSNNTSFTTTLYMHESELT